MYLWQTDVDWCRWSDAAREISLYAMTSAVMLLYLDNDLESAHKIAASNLNKLDF
jgi:hypothetical protein